MCLYLRTKFQISSLTLTIFRQEELFTHHPLTLRKTTPKKPNLIRIKYYLNFKIAEILIQLHLFLVLVSVPIQ